ncbi:hypothetical protein CONPUDRAFT_131142 [Coniophora puteana RWD-64-598 SS2]|uniref:Uncharacterized protein n=1 Tax=Coniophora puteana (strain RWD-64-598) TaxID=741705 RepID=A0A5M3MB57_CONPW|nr:uncharacterized protein CONPUDRAFT_131142 [Coniophora puteana RWD-64-598 SS2]EIW76498.1 hypothetical protein CONPUDRAFT_131142 [Coniophora puteana RWD-64-598 SS2]
MILRALSVFWLVMLALQVDAFDTQLSAEKTTRGIEDLLDGDGTRSLASILSACFLTIFACVYTAVHPNIPSPYDSTFKVACRRTAIVIMAVLAPELIVVWAARQYVSAREFTKEMNEYIKSESILVDDQRTLHGSVVSETITGTVEHPHSPLLPTSAGIPRKSQNVDYEKRWGWFRPRLLSDDAWSHEHSFFAYMGGFMLYYEGKPWCRISPPNLLKALRAGSITADITKAEISDCSKGDFISKGVVILQVTWFAIQLLARVANGVYVAPLEWGTLAFALLSFFTYVLWWKKPLDVFYPRRVRWIGQGDPPTDLHIDDLHPAGGTHQLSDDAFSPLVRRLLAPIHFTLQMIGLWEENDRFRVDTFGGDDIDLFGGQTALSRKTVGIGTAAWTIFGIVNAIAGRYQFPTHSEQVSWVAISATMPSMPYWPVWTAWVINQFRSCQLRDDSTALWVIMCFTWFAYVVCRVILISLMFASLRQLPLDAYKVLPWTGYIPHL